MAEHDEQQERGTVRLSVSPGNVSVNSKNPSVSRMRFFLDNESHRMWTLNVPTAALVDGTDANGRPEKAVDLKSGAYVEVYRRGDLKSGEPGPKWERMKMPINRLIEMKDKANENYFGNRAKTPQVNDAVRGAADPSVETARLTVSPAHLHIVERDPKISRASFYLDNESGRPWYMDVPTDAVKDDKSSAVMGPDDSFMDHAKYVEFPVGTPVEVYRRAEQVEGARSPKWERMEMLIEDLVTMRNKANESYFNGRRQKVEDAFEVTEAMDKGTSEVPETSESMSAQLDEANEVSRSDDPGQSMDDYAQDLMDDLAKAAEEGSRETVDAVLQEALDNDTVETAQEASGLTHEGESAAPIL